MKKKSKPKGDEITLLIDIDSPIRLRIDGMIQGFEKIEWGMRQIKTQLFAILEEFEQRTNDFKDKK